MSMQSSHLIAYRWGVPQPVQVTPNYFDAIITYFITKNEYFECLQYEVCLYYAGWVFSLMNLYLILDRQERWSHIVVPFLVIDILTILRLGNIISKPQALIKIAGVFFSIITYVMNELT